MDDKAIRQIKTSPLAGEAFIKLKLCIDEVSTPTMAAVYKLNDDTRRVAMKTPINEATEYQYSELCLKRTGCVTSATPDQ